MSSVIPPEIEPPKHLQKPLGLSLKSLPLSSPLGTARQPLLLQLKPLQALPPVSQFLQASLLESDIDDGDGNSFNYGDINFTNSTNASNQEPDEKQTPLVENKLTQNPVQLQSLSDAESPMLPESGFGETGNNSDRTNSPNIDIVRSQNLASNPQDFPAVRQTSTTPLPISLSAKVELNQGLLDSPQTTPEIPNVSVQPKNIQRIPETGVSTPENFGQQVTPEISNVVVQPGDIQRTSETAVSTPENFAQQ